VFGSPAATDGIVIREQKGNSSRQATAVRLESVVEGNKVIIENARASSHGTVLTLRLKKSDIDAAGKDGGDALAKKAIVNTYAGNGHGLSSVNSWIKSSSTTSPRAR